ncbi:MAG: PKD domain-containing protein [Chloroflexota bacterium]
MRPLIGKERLKNPRRQGTSLLFLLLPLMCGVMFFASQLGALSDKEGRIERQMTPFVTADYRAWYEIIFAPIDEGLLTQVAAEGNGEIIVYDGIATAVPTIDRRPPVGIPVAIAQQANDTSPNQAPTNSQVPTDAPIIAQAMTDTPDIPTQASTATATITASPTATSTDTETPTSTATDTLTPTPSTTPTIVPSNTPVPTNTPSPSQTPIPAPRVNFGASPQSGTAPLTVDFIDLSSGDITSYSWNFGDGTTSTLASPSHTFTAAGSYYVRFDVSGPGGTAAAGVTINVSASAPPTPIPPPVEQAPVQQNPVSPPQPTNDNDNDGVPNDRDICPNAGDRGFGLQANGCPMSPPDTDGDGFFDNDACPNQGNQGYGVDSTGCPNPPVDSDGDGFFDNDDTCPSQAGVAPDGCPASNTSNLNITSIWLVNADTDADIMQLVGGETINFSTGNYSIRAYVESDVDSVIFTVGGQSSTESFPPYVIGGDSSGDIAPWTFANGTYTLVVTGYAQDGGNGASGAAVSIQLTFTN